MNFELVPSMGWYNIEVYDRYVWLLRMRRDQERLVTGGESSEAAGGESQRVKLYCGEQ